MDNVKRIEDSIYTISRDGVIVNTKTGRIIKQSINSKYTLVSIRFKTGRGKTTVTVHRLVANAFIPNPENKPQINHIDGNKKNNCASNLEWVTQSENMRHGWSIGLFKKESYTGRTGAQGCRSISVICVETQARFCSQKDLANHIGITPAYVRYCLDLKKQIRGLTYIRHKSN